MDIGIKLQLSLNYTFIALDIIFKKQQNKVVSSQLDGHELSDKKIEQHYNITDFFLEIVAEGG